jgi:hypothetical protein
MSADLTQLNHLLARLNRCNPNPVGTREQDAFVASRERDVGALVEIREERIIQTRRSYLSPKKPAMKNTTTITPMI